MIYGHPDSENERLRRYFRREICKGRSLVEAYEKSVSTWGSKRFYEVMQSESKILQEFYNKLDEEEKYKED